MASERCRTQAPRLSLLTTSLTFLLCLLPASASASPWIVDDGTTVIGVFAGADFADSEFLPQGDHQAFPLDGRFNSYYLEVSARRGFPLGFEMSLKAALKGVSYRADPVLLVVDASNPPSTLAQYRDAVLDFSRQRFGLADLHLAVAHQHVKSPLRLASRLTLKVPAGYDKPEGTFRDEQVSDAAIEDDVALGDGQVDLEYGLLAGYVVPPTGTALQAGAGYRVRFGGPGHQVTGLFKVGQLITRYVLVYAALDTVVTVFDGDDVGLSYTAVDPGVPARSFSAANIRPIPLTLDRDYLTVTGGAIVRVLTREWVVSVSHVAWGRNVSRTTGFSLGVLLPFK